MILGDPGSGKTTLLHYLALRAAKGAEKLPIFVPLAAYDDWLRRSKEATSLGEFLPIYYERWYGLDGLAPLFRRSLDEGRALVLLDGLDEVLDVTTRQFVSGEARALMQREIGRGNRFVITSRVIGYREAPLPGELPHVTVLDFGEAEIASFAHKWCEAVEVWLADGQQTETALARGGRCWMSWRGGCSSWRRIGCAMFERGPCAIWPSSATVTPESGSVHSKPCLSGFRMTWKCGVSLPPSSAIRNTTRGFEQPRSWLRLRMMP